MRVGIQKPTILSENCLDWNLTRKPVNPAEPNHLETLFLMKQCSMTKAALTVSSTVKLLSGNEIPRLGFGVYQNRDFIIPSTLEALKAGYRCVQNLSPRPPLQRRLYSLLLIMGLLRHIDSAQVYRNEAEVADAVRQSGLRRQDVFISMSLERLAPRVCV